MKTTNCFTSACRYCSSYNPQGRRGGMCEQLGVPVQAQWKSCTFAKHPFHSHWETLDEIALLEKSFSLSCDSLELENNLSKTKSSLQEQEALAVAI